MTLTPEDLAKVHSIFFPYADMKLKDAKSKSMRFAYYTSAETAFSILKHKQIWMRNAKVMNDYEEIEYGFDCLNKAYKGEAGESFNSALDKSYPDLSKEVKDYFNNWLPIMRDDTFITCLSEHSSKEDTHGRLSMWRAYGSPAGVALVINHTLLYKDEDILGGVHTQPVYYPSQDEYAIELMRIADRMKEEDPFLREIGRDNIRNIVFNMFRLGVLCTKHPGFDEEREWRILSTPGMHKSDYLIESVESVRGIPQKILKLDLVNHEEKGVIGLAIPELLNKIIIGPCEFPVAIFNAFLELLREADVSNPETKIVVSNIPLRNL